MEKGTETKNRYFCRTKAGWLTLILLLLCVVLLSLRFGSAAMDGQAFWGGLLRQEGFETQSLILYSLRLPRLLQGILAGVGLSVSGVLLQSVTGNDLASPSIIGVNAGAGFAVILLLSFFPHAAAGLPPAAFLGDRRPDGCLKGHRHSGRDRRAGASECGDFLPFSAGHRCARVL